jgi:hypothetical protein
MEPYLLYRDSSTDGKKSYAFPRDMVKDLNLDIVFKTMAKQDDLIYEKVRRVMMLPLTTPEEVYYRQEVLRDLRRQDSMLEDLYAIAVRQNKALKDLKAAIKSNRAKSTRKTSELFECLNYLMQGQDDLLKIRELLLQKKDAWQSEGVRNLLERLKEMPLESIKERLREANSLTTGCEAGYTFQFGGGMKMEKAELNFVRPNTDAKKNGLENFYLTFLKRNAILIGTDVTLQEDVNHLAEETLGQIIAIFQPYLQKMMVFYEHYCEEISFYMGENYRIKNVNFRRYTVRLDGFFSWQAPYSGAEVLTKPLMLSGEDMNMNFSTSAVGGIKVFICDENGAELDGYESYTVFGNSVERPVTFAKPLSDLAGKTVRLRFKMKDADIYSFVI